MNTKKLVKWGVALTSTLVLGGVVAPVGSQLLDISTIVYAEEQPVTYRIHYYLNDVAENGGVPSYTDIAPYKEGVISKGETITEVAPHIDGYVVNGANSISITYDDVTGDNVWHDEDWYPSDGFLYDKVETPTDKPADQPAEQPADQPAEQPTEQPVDKPADQPAEQPVEQPADQPVEKPISVLIGAISEVDGPLSHYYVTINPGETKTVETPKVDGYKLDQYTSPTYELTYDNALKQLNSAGFAWVQFWMIKDAAPETPVEQPTEQPVEQPAEVPVEQPVDTPTDKPVEQLTDASSLTDQTAGKVQAVTATDKKTVDKSAPSTPAVKPEEVSQPVAKTLPKTGDSSSMLLVLGGVLSGLSGLGLAATSRKRD
ncbi:TPA: LPXTG cell wall anchor domain-containing protein [Streptococcus suis]|nr:LPXTG cell wall anchor domain-containing protein [Streptococcus suis]HEM5253937.1 LPXTG cell wall anchor domain-containing protein [Streptococcus suis]